MMWENVKTLIVVIWLSIIINVFGIVFNRNLTGVIFLPYVLNNTNEYTIYSIDDIKTMLKVVSKRFSRVATMETFNTDIVGDYKENITYFNTYSEIYTATAAATVNREAVSTNSSIIITVYIGIILRDDPEEMATEIKLAFESARKSNQIYSGTVPGVILSRWGDDLSENGTVANLAVLEGQKVKSDAKLLGLQVGIKMYCDTYLEDRNTSENISDPLYNARKNILLEFDFLICIQYAEEYYPLGISRTIELVTKNLVQLRDSVQSINPNISFMIETCISSFGTSKNHYQYQLDFWTQMDAWGTQNNISVWFYEAFDNPWEVELNGPKAEYGWWKFKSDQALTDVNAYKEIVDILLLPDFNSEQDVKSTDKSTYVWVVVGSIIGPAIGSVTIYLLISYACRTFNTRQTAGVLTRQDIQEFVNGILKDYRSNMENENIEQKALNRPYDKSIEIQKDSLEICWSTILGCGEFGVVYKARIFYSSKNIADDVALKTTKDDCSKTAVMSILSEIKILSYLGHHKHIVAIKGAYTAEIEKGVVYIATELCELGSLKDFLRKSSGPDTSQVTHLQQFPGYVDLPSNVKCVDMARWSFEIACGMEYLAEKNVIHADLATRNVLLTEDKTAKITDFGLSRRLYEYTNYVKKKQEPLPWRWMAIEALRKLEFSTQSDVWSFGVTLWEIYSMGDVPYPGLSWDLNFVDSLESGLRMNSPRLATPEIFALMSSCWQHEPQNRPTFTQLKQSFARIVQIFTNSSEEDIDFYYT